MTFNWIYLPFFRINKLPIPNSISNWLALWGRREWKDSIDRQKQRERERKATEFRLHANSSNLLSNSSLSLCLFRSLFFFFYRSLQLLFKPNQTKPQKKIFQIPENKLQEIYFPVDPCPPFSATNHKKSSHPPQFFIFYFNK